MTFTTLFSTKKSMKSKPKVKIWIKILLPINICWTELTVWTSTSRW